MNFSRKRLNAEEIKKANKHKVGSSEAEKNENCDRFSSVSLPNENCPLDLTLCSGYEKLKENEEKANSECSHEELKENKNEKMKKKSEVIGPNEAGIELSKNHECFDSHSFFDENYPLDSTLWPEHEEPKKNEEKSNNQSSHENLKEDEGKNNNKRSTKNESKINENHKSFGSLPLSDENCLSDIALWPESVSNNEKNDRTFFNTHTKKLWFN